MESFAIPTTRLSITVLLFFLNNKKKDKMRHVTGNATPVKWLGFYMSHPKGNNINNFQMHAFFVGLRGA